jgi:general secretion pathway protein L
MAETASANAAQGLSNFLTWWQQQLADCVPTSLREKMAKARRPAMWSPTDDRAWPAAGVLNESKPFSHSALAQRGGSAALVIGESNGFRREIEMPLAVQDRLQQVLGYELDRLTPLKASELYYDFRIRERNLSAGTCSVELAAAPRSRVDPMLEAAKQRNVDVTRMLLAPADVDSSLDLLKSTRNAADEGNSRRGWITPALAILCGLLALALVAFPLWQMRQYVIALQPLETSAKAEAEAASIVQRQLEKQIGEYNLPLARKHGAPLVVQLLDDLSKRLPDDTWAQSLEIRSVPNQKGKEVVLQGETGSGGKILQIVQESPLIKDPAFKATMTRVTPTAERFHIAAEIVAAELPKPLLLSDASAVITVPVSPSAPAGAPTSAKAGAAAVPASSSVAGTVSPPPGATPAAATAPPTAIPANPAVQRSPSGAAASGTVGGSPPTPSGGAPGAPATPGPPGNGAPGAPPGQERR